MRKIIFAVSSLLVTSLLFTACNKKEETYSVPAQNEIQLINGTWLTASSGKELNMNAMPDPDEMMIIDTAIQKTYTEFMGDGIIRSYGTFAGMDLDTTYGSWYITPDKYLRTSSTDLGARNYFIYQINDSSMTLKVTEEQPNRWITYYKVTE